MKRLIVNADDFGYSFGVNRGIVKAHVEGIVTSTSVMVDGIAAEEAASLAQYPGLSVGLHFVLQNTEDIVAEIENQIKKFIRITGGKPTHLDIHKTTDDMKLREVMDAYARRHGIPFRYSGDHMFINTYIGSGKNGDVSINRLKESLMEATGELNELMCHAGITDDYILQHSSYNTLREQELKTLCSKEAKELLKTLDLQLTSYKEYVL